MHVTDVQIERLANGFIVSYETRNVGPRDDDDFGGRYVQHRFVASTFEEAVALARTAFGIAAHEAATPVPAQAA